jgi:hypothetical protein
VFVKKCDRILSDFATRAYMTIQVDDLTNLFRNTFKYDVQELQLQATNAQLTLNSRVMTWACEHNSTDNLLIIYYAGHGIWDIEQRVLEFAPYDTLIL